MMGSGGSFDPGTAAAWALGRVAPGMPEEKQVITALTEVASGPVSRREWAALTLYHFGPAAVEAVPSSSSS